MKASRDTAIKIAGWLIGMSIASASSGATYLAEEKPFIAIKDVNREAEAWATCAASYDIMAELIGPQSARAQQLSELANGSELAVTMALVIDDLSEEMEPERFEALWTYAKHAGQEIPKTRRTAILADAETLGSDNSEMFVNKISETVKICVENLELQQMYIDMWRELAKSGLLKLPKD